MTTSSKGRSESGRGAETLRAPPWTRVRRVQLIRREVREYLPASAVEVLLSEGDTVFEGGAELTADGEVAAPRVYATAMITIDLAPIADRFRDPADAATAARVAELLTGHPELAPRLATRIRPQLPALAGHADAKDWEISIETEVRAEGCVLFVDADVVAAPRGAQVG